MILSWAEINHSTHYDSESTNLPSVPPCLCFRYFHSGSALSPLTSIFSNMSNFTPKLSATYFFISVFGHGSYKYHKCKKCARSTTNGVIQQTPASTAWSVYDWRQLFNRLVGASHFFRRRRRGSFSTAIATQLIWKISGVIPTDLRPCGLLGKGQKASPLTKACICHSTDCLFAIFEVINRPITSPSRPTVPCLHYLHQECDTSLSFPDLWDCLKSHREFSLTLNAIGRK